MFQIKTGTERPACALEHHYTRLAVALKTFEIGVQRLDQSGIERIEAIRTIERHPVNAIFVFDQQWLGHAINSASAQCGLNRCALSLAGEGVTNVHSTSV